jgi:hypothetical protein
VTSRPQAPPFRTAQIGGSVRRSQGIFVPLAALSSSRLRPNGRSASRIRARGRVWCLCDGQGLGSPGRPPGRLSGLPESVRPAGRCQLSEWMRPPFRLMCRTGCGRVGRLPEDLAWCARPRAAQQPGSRDAQQGGWNAAASPALCGRR